MKIAFFSLLVFEKILSTENRVSSDEDLLNGESLWQQLMEPFSKLQQTTRTSAKGSPHEEKKSSRSSSITTNIERVATSPVTSLVRRESQTSPASSIPPPQPNNQPITSPKQQVPTLGSHSRSSSITSPTNEKSSPINTIPLAFESLRPLSESPQQSSEVQRSRNSSTTSVTMKEQPILKSPSTPSQEQQPSSPTAPIVSEKQSLPPTSDPSTVSEEDQPSSRTSSISLKTSLDSEKSPVTVVEQQSLLGEEQPSSRTSSISSKASSDQQKSLFFTTVPTVSESQSTVSNAPQLSSPLPEDTPMRSTLSQTPVTIHFEQEESSPNTADDYQITTSTGK